MSNPEEDTSVGGKTPIYSPQDDYLEGGQNFTQDANFIIFFAK